jgi:glycosyltransferase involved in cell wall biosynthesis
MKKNTLSIIIPAYNEEQRITETLLDIDHKMSGQTFGYEILIVNDGSTDNTVSVVEKLQKQIPKLFIINNSENRGKGFAIKQGMLKAIGDFRLFMDADNSTKIDEVFKMLPYFNQGFDVVIGSRYIDGSEIVIKQPLKRIFFGRIFRIITHMLIPLGVTDLVCGFKIFTAKSAETIFPKQTIFRWSFDVEILTIAKKNGFKIKELPVRWKDNAKSRVNFSGMLKSFLEIIQIKLRF